MADSSSLLEQEVAELLRDAEAGIKIEDDDEAGDGVDEDLFIDEDLVEQVVSSLEQKERAARAAAAAKEAAAKAEERKRREKQAQELKLQEEIMAAVRSPRVLPETAANLTARAPTTAGASAEDAARYAAYAARVARIRAWLRLSSDDKVMLSYKDVPRLARSDPDEAEDQEIALEGRMIPHAPRVREPEGPGWRWYRDDAPVQVIRPQEPSLPRSLWQRLMRQPAQRPVVLTAEDLVSMPGQSVNLSYQDLGDAFQQRMFHRQLRQLRHAQQLHLTNNLLTSLRSYQFSSLLRLSLCDNAFSRIADLPRAPRLLDLNLARNDISDVAGLRRRYPRLQHLVLKGNPVASQRPDYIPYVVASAGTALATLDGVLLPGHDIKELKLVLNPRRERRGPGQRMGSDNNDGDDEEDEDEDDDW